MQHCENSDQNLFGHPSIIGERDNIWVRLSQCYLLQIRTSRRNVKTATVVKRQSTGSQCYRKTWSVTPEKFKNHSSWSFRFFRLLNGRMLLIQSLNRQCHSVFLVRTLFSGMNSSLSSDGSEVIPISFSESGSWGSIFDRFFGIFGCFLGRFSESRVLLLVWGVGGSSEGSLSSESSESYNDKWKILLIRTVRL